MVEKEILTEEQEGILRVYLNRSKVRNALNTSMMDEITSIIKDPDRFPKSSVVVFSGKEGSFCSGSDFRELSADREIIHRHLQALANMYKALMETPKFLIAEVYGNALGGGTGLAMNCDWIIASEGARFGLPEMQRGFLPALALVPLSRKNSERILELTMTGEVLTASQALALRLVSQVLPEGKVAAKVDELARMLVSRDAESAGIAKQVCRSILSMDYDRAVDYAAEIIQSRLYHDKGKEGK